MKKFLFLFLWMFVIGGSQAQKIKGYEYWIDDNIGGKVYASITLRIRVFHLQTDLPLLGVSIGFHTLNLRFSTARTFGAVCSRNFYKNASIKWR